MIQPQNFPNSNIFFCKEDQFKCAGCQNNQYLEQLFHLPLSGIAFEQLQNLLTALEAFANDHQSDSWSYIWCSQLFSSSKTYKHLTGTALIHPAYSLIWKSTVQHKHKTFFWLLLKDRLSTRGLLRRRNMDLPSYNCVLCAADIEENMHHLFLQCPFAQQCWSLLHLHISDPTDLHSSLDSLNAQLHVPFFMDIVVLLSWSIWMARNDLIFRNVPPSLQNVKNTFQKEFTLVILRAKKNAPLVFVDRYHFVTRMIFFVFFYVS